MPYRTAAVPSEDNRLYSGSLDCFPFEVPLAMVVPLSSEDRADWWSEADRIDGWGAIRRDNGKGPYVKVQVHMTLRMWASLGASIDVEGVVGCVPSQLRHDIINILADRMRDLKKPIYFIGREEMVLFHKSLLLLRDRHQKEETAMSKYVEEARLRKEYHSSRTQKVLFELLGILSIPIAGGLFLYQVAWAVFLVGVFASICVIARESSVNKGYAALRRAEEEDLLLAERTESLVE